MAEGARVRVARAKGRRAASHEAVADWRTASSRLEKSERIRDALLRAATEVVGDVGYAEASIALITQRAGVAQGTFYNYFRSRQDILDQLLPEVGQRMLRHVHDSAVDGAGFAEREERSFRAFFSFLEDTPQLFRILNEAESFAPSGYKAHIDAVSRGYQRFLRNAQRRGEFSDYADDELEVVSYILMAARSYLAFRYTSGGDAIGAIPDRVVSAYMKFVLYGLQGRAPADDAARARRPAPEIAAAPEIATAPVPVAAAAPASAPVLAPASAPPSASASAHASAAGPVPARRRGGRKHPTPLR